MTINAVKYSKRRKFQTELKRDIFVKLFNLLTVLIVVSKCKQNNVKILYSIGYKYRFRLVLF